MEKSNSYVYFALKGDDFDPSKITDRMGINPSQSWRKGDKGTYNPNMKYSSWEFSTDKGEESILIDNLVGKIVDQFYEKIDIVNELKKELGLTSVLEIVLHIDVNEEMPTPALGHDSRVIEFLYKTNTITDVDIYRYNSAEGSEKRV